MGSKIGGLTPKQAKFTTVLLKQLKETGEINGTQAALASYDTTDPNTAHSIASENLQNPTIQNRIEQALASQGLTPDTIIGNLKKIANSEVVEPSPDVILRTNVELLKLYGAYPGTKNTQVSLSVHANLKDMKFQDLQKEVQVIDGELEELLGNVSVDNLSTSESE